MMRWPLPTDAARREAWREHCAPLIEAGATVVYGSSEHLEIVARERAEKAAKAAEMEERNDG